MSDTAFLGSLLRTEAAWSATLVSTGIAPPQAGVGTADLAAVPIDPGKLAEQAESGGNPAIALVRALRSGLPEPAATWLHRGLTSQDAIDTALMLCARDAIDAVLGELRTHVAVLAAAAAEHRAAPMVARTLTQPAVPTTFGAKAADWLRGVLDTAGQVTNLEFPVQLGGAGGTLAAVVELGGLNAARATRNSFADELGLAPSSPWHTRRTPILRIGDAAGGIAGAWGRITNDVLVLGRPEVGEVCDGSDGGSSTMPHKTNPTLAILVRRHALATPGLIATLHATAAAQVDERADGGWHAEWATLATLLRRSVVAAAQTTDLLRGLRIDTARMAARAAETEADLRAEQHSMAQLAGHAPSDVYLGLADDLIQETIARSKLYLQETEHDRRHR